MSKDLNTHVPGSIKRRVRIEDRRDMVYDEIEDEKWERMSVVANVI